MHVTALLLGELGIVNLFYMFSNNWFQDAHFLRWLIYLFIGSCCRSYFFFGTCCMIHIFW